VLCRNKIVSVIVTYHSYLDPNKRQTTLQPSTCSNQQAVPITLHKSIYHKSQIEEFMTVCCRWKKELNDCFNATVPSLMMGQWGPKQAGFYILWHYCDSDEFCAFWVYIVLLCILVLQLFSQYRSLLPTLINFLISNHTGVNIPHLTASCLKKCVYSFFWYHPL